MAERIEVFHWIQNIWFAIKLLAIDESKDLILWTNFNLVDTTHNFGKYQIRNVS